MTLKIERIPSNRGTQIRMSGDLRSDQLAQVMAEIEGSGASSLDLQEIDLVDVESVRFLCACEARGILVLYCSPYIRQWILHEQAGKNEGFGRS